MDVRKQANDKMFRIEEYKALRAEIDHHLKAVSDLQLAIIAGIAAIYAFADKSTTNKDLILYSMPILVLLGILACLPHYIRTKSIGKYILTIERELIFENSRGGWEKFLLFGGRGDVKLNFLEKAPFIYLDGIAWIAIFIGSFVLIAIR